MHWKGPVAEQVTAVVRSPCMGLALWRSGLSHGLRHPTPHVSSPFELRLLPAHALPPGKQQQMRPRVTQTNPVAIGEANHRTDL